MPNADLIGQRFGVPRLVHGIVSKLLVALIVVCGAISALMYVFVFLPRWQAATKASLWYLTCFTGWLWTATAYHFYRAVSIVPDATAETVVGPSVGATNICKKCDSPKASFVHHCNVCGRCVPMMDHHCPFINNCAGRHNFVHFIFFLGCATTGAALASCA